MTQTHLPPPDGPGWSAVVWRTLPCWLVSALVHMAIIILLGVWIIHAEGRGRPLAIAATIDTPASELPTEPLADLSLDFDQTELEPAPELAAAALEADQVELTQTLSNIEQPAVDLLPPPDLSRLPTGRLEPGQVLAGRDPRFRGQLAMREGGSTDSEAAVALALKWFEHHQNSDGSWSLDRFNHAGDCGGKCGDQAHMQSDTAATSLALLPFLAAGETHLRGDYTLTIARGLRWLMDHQGSDGDLRGQGQGNMYAHGQAAIVLCEALALTQADNLREPAQRAIDFIVAAQHPAGGWRYRPGEAGDLSVVGWQVMALRSAQMAYLRVPPDVFTKINNFLGSVQINRAEGWFGYMPGAGVSYVMTAEGLLCRQYSGWHQNNPQLRKGVRWLMQGHLPKADQPNYYYWYYATQAMHHMGGETWQEWNSVMRDMLVSTQSKNGHETGSWAPIPGANHDHGGRLYATSLATLTLEVYYRHLPLYRGAAIEQAPRSSPSRPSRKR